MGELVRAIGMGKNAVCYTLDATDMVAAAEGFHHTSAVVTAALGRLMTAASMMGAMLKGEGNSITLRITANGPIGSVIAVADHNGTVKGYVEHPVVELPLNAQGKLDVSGAIGEQGQLYVIKDIGAKEPYVGLTPLVSGEIAEDITHYFAVSQQIPTACALGVLVNPDLTVQGAGGVLLQLLPGASQEDIAILEENLQALPPVSQLFGQGVTATQVAQMALRGLEPEILEVRQVEYRCDCSRERMERALAALGEAQLLQIVEEDGKAEACCHFCNKKYLFSDQEIISLIPEING